MIRIHNALVGRLPLLIEPVHWWLSLKWVVEPVETTNTKNRFCFLFFCLETKEPKVQDLDLFTKKWLFLLRKFPNLRGLIVSSSMIGFGRASNTGNFYMLLIGNWGWKKLPFLLTQKSPKSSCRSSFKRKI